MNKYSKIASHILVKFKIVFLEYAKAAAEALRS